MPAIEAQFDIANAQSAMMAGAFEILVAVPASVTPKAARCFVAKHRKGK